MLKLKKSSGVEAPSNKGSFFAPPPPFGGYRDVRMRVAAIMNPSPTKQNTISAAIVVDCFHYQSDRACTARMVRPKNLMETDNVSSNRQGH
jgi:hypothetical protein